MTKRKKKKENFSNDEDLKKSKIYKNNSKIDPQMR